MRYKEKVVRSLIFIVIAIIIGMGEWLRTDISHRKIVAINNEGKNSGKVESKMEYDIVDTTIKQIKDNKPLKIVGADNISYVDYLWGAYGYTYDNKVITNYMIGDKDDPKVTIESNKRYLLDINTGAKELLLSEDNGEIHTSPDGTKIIFQTGSEVKGNIINYIYDVRTKKKKVFSKGAIRGVFSKDSSKFMFYDLNNEVVEKINMYDIRNEKVSSIQYNNKIKLGNMIGIENDDLYFNGMEEKGDNIRSGVYKVNFKSTNDVKIVFTFPFYNKLECKGIDDNRGYNFDVINDGRSVIFSGVINKKWGIFIFDTSSNKIYQVALTSNTNFYLSPDKSRLIYIYSSGSNAAYKLNVYAACIGNDKLYNITEIKLDKSVINAEAYWSCDSERALFLEYGEKDSKTMACPRILNLVTFEK